MTTALSTPPAIIPTVADLVLLRMALPNAAPKKTREDVGKLLEGGLAAAEFDILRNQLTAAGFLTKGKRNTFAITDAGRDQVRQIVGVAELPSRTTWSALIAKYLFPWAAGISANAAAKLDKGEKLVAFVLKRKYGLAAGAGSTRNQVAEALVCKELGFPSETTVDGLFCAVLSKLLGAERLTKEKLVEQLPFFETGLKATDANSARLKVVRDWLTGTPTPRQPREARTDEQLDLPEFAATIRALAANSAPQDRFHDNKVFIAALWRASQREPNFPRFSLPKFKQRLIDANARTLLHLSRADLVEAMDPQLVAESETKYLNGTFHFVLLEGKRL